MTTTNVIKKGDVFIIPNRLMKMSEIIDLPEYPQSQMWEKFRDNIHKDLPEVPKDSAYVQVWCCTPGQSSSNWGCHREMDGEDFPSYLPISLFKGKKEGDTIQVPTRWGLVELTLNQEGYRYCRFGSFEGLLQRLLSL